MKEPVAVPAIMETQDYQSQPNTIIQAWKRGRLNYSRLKHGAVGSVSFFPKLPVDGGTLRPVYKFYERYEKIL